MTDALTSHLPLDHCPRCGYKLDAATSMDFETPQPGDLSVCIQCAAILEWDSAMRLQLFDLNRLTEISTENLMKLMNTVAAIGYVTPRARHDRN